ncbi:MAG: VWA domain-containing protein [Pseudomonadota bacterium]
MRFAHPYLLLLIFLCVPVLLILRSRGAAFHFSSLAHLKGLKPLTELGIGNISWKRTLPLILRIAVVALVIIAMARPQHGRKETEVESVGVDIILTLDTSGSMAALDFTVGDKRASRLDAVGSAVADFLEKRPGDRIGMVVFGAEAFTQAPLTLDHDLLRTLLSDLEVGMAGDSTAIGDAIAVGTERIKNLKAQSKVMVLMTDGRSNSGQIAPEKAAEIAAAFGIKVYTIGIGTNKPAPFMVDTVFGKQMVYQRVDLDEDTLRKIAEITKAKYYNASDTGKLASIYGDIDKLEKSGAKVKEYVEYDEFFHLFLIPAIIIFLVEILLSRTRLRKIP